MSYTIDERNPERQYLLAQVLNPTTREVLARLPRIPAAMSTAAVESDVAEAYGFATLTRMAPATGAPRRLVFLGIPWAHRSADSAAPSASDDSTT